MKDSFFRNASFLAAAEVIARLKALVFLPLLTHHLGTVNFGVWSQVTLLVSLAIPLVTLVSENGIIRVLPGLDKSVAARRFSAWLLFLTANAIITSFLIFALQKPLGVLLFDTNSFGTMILLSIVVLWINVFTNSFKSWMRVENDARALSFFTLLQSFMSLAALTSSILQGVDVFTVVLYLAAGDAAVLIAMAVKLRFRRAFAQPDWGCLQNILRFSLPLLPAAYALWAVNFIDRFFLVQYQGLDTVGAFSFAYSLSYMIIQVAIAPVWAMFPNLAAQHYNCGDLDALQQLFNRSAGTLFLIGAPAVGGIAVVAYDLISIVGGPSFASAAATMPILLAGYLFMLLSAYFEVAAGLKGFPSRSTAAVFVAVFVNIALNALLIPSFGIMGAAWATLAAYASQFTYIWIATKKHHIFAISMTFAMKIILLSSAMSIAAFFIKESINHKLWSLAITITGGITIYAIGSVLSGIIPPTIMQRTRKLWR